MNIFDIYLDKIKKIILDQCKNGLLKAPVNFNSINVDIPPKQFDCDISTNVAMVLSKINQKSPIDLANQLIELIKNNNGKKIVKNLYSLISKKPNKFLNRKQLREDKNRAISDFISGMTDRYAINLYKNTK